MKIKYFSKILILSILFITCIICIILESILVDKISVLIVFISLLLLGAKEKTFINPYNLFALTPLSLLLYFNISDAYMLDLTHKTYLLAIINMIPFILALSLTPASSFKIKKMKRRGVRHDSKLFLRINTFVLLGLSLTGYLIPLLASVFWLFSVAGIVCALKTKEKRMFIVVVIYLFIIASLGLSKMAVLLYLIIFLISLDKFYVFSGKKSVWIKIFTGISIFFLVYSFSFTNKDRGDYNADSGVSYYKEQGVDWQFDTSVFLPYMYVTSPWANLQYVTETQDTRTYGLWAIKPFLGYFGLDNYFKEEYTLEPYSSFNTFTFITVGFKDFGYWFSILPTLILGVLGKKVYSRYLISLSPFDIATYVVFALAILEMFFSNHFYMQSYPFTMLILMWGYRHITSKN